MKHASTWHNPAVCGILEWLYTQCKILFQLLLETVIDMTGSDKLTLFAKERRVIDGKEHRHCRLINGDWRQWFWVFIVTEGVTNLKLVQSDDRTDITTFHFSHLLVTHTVKSVYLLDFGLLHLAVSMRDSNVHSLLQHATMNTSYSDTTGVRTIIQWRDEHLRCALQVLRSWDYLYYLVEKIVDIVSRSIVILCHPAILCRAIYHREVQLILCSIEREHKVEDHFIHLFRTTVRLIHLVYHHNRLQSYLKSLLKHETCLRHWTLKGIYKENTSVSHIEDTLHFTTEVRVSRSIYDIDFCTFPIDRYILRENGYATFTFKVVGIKYLVWVVLTFTEKFSGKHHLIDQSSLSMVNVSDDGDVSNILHNNFDIYAFVVMVKSFPTLYIKADAKVLFFCEIGK